MCDDEFKALLLMLGFEYSYHTDRYRCYTLGINPSKAVVEIGRKSITYTHYFDSCLRPRCVALLNTNDGRDACVQEILENLKDV